MLNVGVTCTLRFCVVFEIEIAVGKAEATLPSDRVPTSKDWAKLSAGWRQDLDDRILHLERLRDNLAGCIGCGCLSLKTCALSNPGDVLADQGPGAVRL